MNVERRNSPNSYDMEAWIMKIFVVLSDCGLRRQCGWNLCTPKERNIRDWVVWGILGLIRLMGKTVRLLRFKDHCPDNHKA